MRRLARLVLSTAFLSLTTLAHADPSTKAPTVAHLASLSPKTPLANANGRVPVTLRLHEGEDAKLLGAREIAPGLALRWVPETELAAFVESSRERAPWVSPPLHPTLDQSGKWTRSIAAHQELGLTGKGVIVAVIDTGLDLAHPDLQDASGHTRVAWLLDLGASAPLGKHPDLEAKYGCTDPNAPPCAIYSGADIDAELAVSASGATLPSDDIGHGTHVSSIAAGNGGPNPTYVGMAPDATLIEVRVTRDGTSDAITDADILSSVGFVFDRASDLGMPAVVNLSLGGDFGPHDGTSPLESGLGSLVGPNSPGRAIVVAAGNSAALIVDQAGDTFGAHTESRVLEGETGRAVLSTPDSTATTMSGTAYVWINYRAGEDIKVGVEMNGSTVIDPVASGDTSAVNGDSGHPYLAVLNGVSANSPLVAGSYGAIVNIDGMWSTTDRFAITFEGAGEIQAWVQGAGDAEFGSATGGELFLQAIKQGTINVPATAPSLISVGCTLNRLSWTDAAAEPIVVQQVGSVMNPTGDSACYFSAAGPNALGVPKPELAAPGGFVVAAMSSLADPATNPNSMFQPPDGRCPQGGNRCYVIDPHHALASGTSMSAPHVTGAVALLFQQDPTLTQDRVVAALQGGSRTFQGYVPYDYQLGAGALDIEGAVAAVVSAQAEGPMAPDPTKSWVTLSTGYARPDPTWPIVGDVELRTTSGAPADGFDANQLTLSTVDAVVVTPLTRVGPGLFRFTIAGADGTGGEVLHATVRYGGVAIADRTLPIGADVWATKSVGSARGGCSIANERDLDHSRNGLFLAAFAIASLARRSRRREPS